MRHLDGGHRAAYRRESSAGFRGSRACVRPSRTCAWARSPRCSKTRTGC